MTTDMFLNLEKVVLIDPASPEVNRGSYCYLTYLLASARNYGGWILEHNACLFEEFTMAQLDTVQAKIEQGYVPFVALWSYPQIEYAKALYRFFKGTVFFYGYYPLIKVLGLPYYMPSKEVLTRGMTNYPNNYGGFKHLLLSDCDLHLKGISENKEDKLYPMFTSYSCWRRCAFCSASANTDGIVTILNLANVRDMLYSAHKQGIKYIHFTDEDFFMYPKRAHNILKLCKEFGIRCVALASMISLNNYLQDFVGHLSVFKEVVLLVEVGLETADEELSDLMNKKEAKAKIIPYDLMQNCPVPILWLTVTFFPGETISSLNKTGALLRRIGFKAGDIEPRIVTNGTEGGLGQFFQYYDGVTDETWSGFSDNGLFLTARATRLSPSYIPDSFIFDSFLIDSVELAKRKQDVLFWCGVYGLDFLKMMEFFDSDVQTSLFFKVQKLKDFFVGSFVSVFIEDLAIFIAVLARLNVAVPFKQKEVACA